MTTRQWKNITNYIDTVGTTPKTFSFNKKQNLVKVTTRGNANVTYAIGSQSGTLTPGQSISVAEKITSFNLTSASGTQTIEVWATEDSTQIQEPQTINDQLGDKISKSRRGHKKGLLIENFSANTEWTLQGGTSMAVDTVFTNNGLSSIRIVANAVATFIRRTTRTFDLSAAKAIKLSIYVEDRTKVDKVSLYLSNDTGFANFYNFVTNGTALVDGWNDILINTAKGSVTGAPTLANRISALQVRVDPVSGQNASVVFDGITIDEQQKAKLLFTVDDGWITQYTECFKRLNEKGFKATLAVIPTKVGTTNYVTLANLQELYGYGWDLVNHTNTHVHLGDWDKPTQDSELRIAYNYLMSQGFTRAASIAVLPYGSFNNDTLDIVKTQYRSSRSLIEAMETSPPNNIALTKVHNLLPTVTTATATGWIDDAIATGGTIIFLNHRFGDPAANGGDTMFYNPPDFQTIVDYVYSKKDQIDVVTYSEWLDILNL